MQVHLKFFSLFGILAPMSSRKGHPVQKLGKAAAHHLSALRAAGGFTQSDLAVATGISQGQLSKQLRGYRAINIDELDAICFALDISPHELLRRAEETAQREPINEIAARRKAKAHNPSPDSPPRVKTISDDEAAAAIREAHELRGAAHPASEELVEPDSP